MSTRYLNALRALEASVRHGSFQGASAELNVTPAAVGQQVKKLESLVGSQLLVRRPNGFTATDRALRACRSLRTGLENFRAAIEILEDRGAPQRLAVTIVPSLAEYWFTPKIPDFLGTHPGIDFRIDSTHSEFYEPNDDFDFGLRYESGIARASEMFDLFREWLIPVCRPEVASRIRVDRPADVFADVPLLHVDSETEDRNWANWDIWGRKFAIEIPAEARRLKFRHTTTALRSLFAGHGIHLAQLSIAAEPLAAGELVAPFGSRCCLQTGYPYRLYRFGIGELSGLHLDFVNWMQALAGQTEAKMQSFLAIER